MAKINVNAVVTAPEEVTIPLVRADHHETSNIFRVSFEIFLALFCGLLGNFLSLQSPSAIHYVSLAICGVGAVAFLLISISYTNKSKKV